MQYIKADIHLAKEIHRIVSETIQTVYPNYYPSEVVDFFRSLHSEEHIKQDIADGRVYALFDKDILVGTGSLNENHITRVYVLPKYQGRGYGTYMINHLENKVKRNYDSVVLDASLPAVMLYEKLGYKTVNHQRYELKDAVLVYEIMKKQL